MNYTPQTEVHLLSNVPFNFSYNNVMDFDTINEQTTYFINKSKLEFEDLTHQRVNNNSINLEVAYEDLYDVNYMMFQNEKIPGKWFYAFITSYDFVSPNVTRISYQIDVYQTWLFEMEWQTTYVEREHTKRFNNDGTPVINTIEEDLQYGTDYKTIYKRKCNDDNIIWLVAITKSPIDKIIEGGVSGPKIVANVGSPLFYTLIPFDLDGQTITIEGNSTGIAYIFNLGKSSETVGQLVSLYYVPYVPFNYSVSNSNNVTVNDGNVHLYKNNTHGAFYQYYGLNQWSPSNYNVSNNMYSLMGNYSESKLYMYPYTVIELTDMQGNTATLKPQNFDSKALSFDIMSCISTQPKTAIYPHGYLGNTTGNVIDFTDGIINNNICDIPIVDDYTASYMQANRNSIATTNKYTMDNAIRGVSQNNATNRLNNAIMDRQQQYNQAEMFTSALTGGIGNALSGNLVGAIGSVAGSLYKGVKSYDLNEAKRAGMNLNNEFANRNLMINAEQAIGLTQAKINDINNIPPTVSNLGNNTMFDTGWKNMHFYVMIKTVRDEFKEQLTNYFKMFGYKVNKLEIPNTKSRQNYNYIKTIDANIVGNIPANDLSAIKGIFDKGVTIWHSDNVGDYSLTNNEVE